MGLRRDWLSLVGFVPSPARMPGGRAHLQGCAGDRWIVYRTQAACRQYAGALGKRPRCPSGLLRVRDYGRPRLRPLMGAGLKGSWLSRKSRLSAAKLGRPRPLNVCQFCTLTFKKRCSYSSPFSWQRHDCDRLCAFLFYTGSARIFACRARCSVGAACPAGARALWRCGAALLACGKDASGNARPVWEACYVGGKRNLWARKLACCWARAKRWAGRSVFAPSKQQALPAGLRRALPAPA